ncbi:retrovirus-related pol polyprotein from transposon RE1 [Citrus sinensis]|nr:retrovirus-related pol polyprotein from transposon RE1 [Citrus sinensis]
MANIVQNNNSFSFVTPVKLDQNNFILWRTQILTSIKGNSLEGFINGDRECPEQFLSSGNNNGAEVLTESGSRSVNPEFVAWMKTDQLLLSWMMSSIQQNLLATVIDSTTSKQLWETLASMFISQSQARIQTLRMQIQTIKKCAMHMSDYFVKVKRIADTLALAGKPIELNDLVMHILTGLDSSDYESLVTAMLARGEKITLDELYSLLLNHENRVEQKKGKIAGDVMHNMTANIAQKNSYAGKNNGNFQKNYGNNYGGGNNSGYGGFNGYGYGQFNTSSNSSEVACQICFIPGHTANRCRNRYNSSFVPQRNHGRGNMNGGRGFNQGQYGRGRVYNGNSGRGFGGFGSNAGFGQNVGFGQNASFGHAPRGFGYQGNIVYPDSNPSAYYSFTPGSSNFVAGQGNNNLGQSSASSSSAMSSSLLEYIEDPSWYIDSGATNHITNDLGKLLDSQAYTGTEKLFVGDGNALAITHIGSVVLNTSNSQSLFLNHVLHVPFITKNLLSISKLLDDNPVTVEFLGDFCFIKARNTGKILLEGVAKGGLYKVSSHAAAHSVFLSSVGQNKIQSLFAWSPIFTSEKPSAVSSYKLNKKLCFSSTSLSCQSTSHSESSFQSSPSSVTQLQAPLAASSALQPTHPDDHQSNASTPVSFSDNSNSASFFSTSHSSPPHTLSQPALSGHPMLTRSKAGIFKPKVYLSALLAQQSEPTSVSKALSDPMWYKAMQEEYLALKANHTWDLVLPATPVKIVGNKWVFRIKYNSDGSVSRYKARLVANGFHQTHGVDYTETFSPVVKSSTIRVILSLAILNHWVIRQVDVNNAFLNGILIEDVYMAQPQGFVDSTKPNHVCKLNKALYGLKQAPRAWFDRFKDAMLSQWHFQHSSNSSTRVSLTQAKYIADVLEKHGMTDCSPVPTPMSTGYYLTKDLGEPIDNVSQYRSVIGALQYVTLTRPDIAFSVNKLSQFLSDPRTQHWDACKRLLRKCFTVAVTVASGLPDTDKRQAEFGAVSIQNENGLPDSKNRKSGFGAPWKGLDSEILKPGVLGGVDVGGDCRTTIIFKFPIHPPSWVAHLYFTIHLGLQFYNQGALQIHYFSDSDWACDHDDRKSVAGFAVYLGPNLVSWSSKKQAVVSRSSTEAEYRSLAHAASEVTWIKSLLGELSINLSSTPMMWCDNQGAIALAYNPVYHAKTKHVELDIHFIRDKVTAKEVAVCYVPSQDQTADVLTKALSFKQFSYFRSKLNVHPKHFSLRGDVRESDE